MARDTELSGFRAGAAVRHALEDLARLDSHKARIARMRLVGRLSPDQIAFFLGEPRDAVDREWRFARAWLASRIACGS